MSEERKILFSNLAEALDKARKEFTAEPELVWIIAELQATKGTWWERAQGDMILHCSERGSWLGSRTIEEAKQQILDGLPETTNPMTIRRHQVMNGERRSHKMSEENWAAIDSIAQDLNITAKTGSRTGLPSWGSLLYQIATGKLVVVPALTVEGFTAIIEATAVAINRLGVRPGWQGARRRILAVLRAYPHRPGSAND